MLDRLMFGVKLFLVKSLDQCVVGIFEMLFEKCLNANVLKNRRLVSLKTMSNCLGGKIMIGSIAVIAGGIYLWTHGYQNGWVIAMIALGVIHALDHD
jgi:hypothetical protein